MKFNNLYFEPYKDIFNYHKEIQKINKGFRLFYNKKNKQLYIINIYNNFEICKSVNSILNINLQDLRFSTILNSCNIFKFIDESNNIIEEKTYLQKKEILNYQLNEFKKLSNRSTKIKLNEVNKIIGANKC